MNRSVPIASALLFAGLFLNSRPAIADTLPGTLCTEDAGSGCMTDISIGLATGATLTITVASDGEAGFDPFGFGADTSDGIEFVGTTVTNQSKNGWVPVGSTTGTTSTWVLPANLTGIGCGSENEPTCEPLGVFLLGQKLAAGFQNTTRFYYMNEAGGGFSDVITVGNDPTTGNGLVTFQSDPVPEPSTTLLFLGGAAVLWGGRRLRTRKP
jgi:hypothetical protein